MNGTNKMPGIAVLALVLASGCFGRNVMGERELRRQPRFTYAFEGPGLAVDLPGTPQLWEASIGEGGYVVAAADEPGLFGGACSFRELEVASVEDALAQMQNAVRYNHRSVEGFELYTLRIPGTAMDSRAALTKLPSGRVVRGLCMSGDARAWAMFDEVLTSLSEDSGKVASAAARLAGSAAAEPEPEATPAPAPDVEPEPEPEPEAAPEPEPEDQAEPVEGPGEVDGSEEVM